MECPCLKLVAEDDYPVDTPDLTPLCGSSCDSTSLSTDFVKMPIAQRYSTYSIYIHPPKKKLNLRSANLKESKQLAIDDLLW